MATVCTLVGASVVVAVTATVGDRAPVSVGWGPLSVVVDPPARVLARSAGQLEIGVGPEDDLNAVIQFVAGWPDLEHLAALNGGRVTGRGEGRIGGRSTTWIQSDNLSGFRFRDHRLAAEGLSVLTRWRPGHDGAVTRILRDTDFDDRSEPPAPPDEAARRHGADGRRP